MSKNQARYPITTLCRLLGVSASGYYAWLVRSKSSRTQSDEILTQKIRTIHLASDGTYGVPRIHAELLDNGIHVGRKRVARLMRLSSLVGVSRRKFVTTTKRDGSRQAPDLVQRKFQADKPNQLWVADITYVPTWAGFIYLAVVLDAFSRLIVGWSMSTTLHRQVVLDALDMAIKIRCPANVIHHSDQGSQYTSIDFGKRCREAGVRPSMGSVGDCYDNAMAESFFATLECELLDRRRFKTKSEARMAIFSFIEGFYNPRRRHSAIGYYSPQTYELIAGEPGADQHAIVLGSVKDKPSVTAKAAVIPDNSCARRRTECAGRDERMGPKGAEQKNGMKEEDKMASKPLL